MNREKTIFDKIIDGETASTKVYEDDYTYAFLDISPVNIGHTLVIPKKFSRNILDMDEETVSHVAKTVRKVAIALKSAVKAYGINIVQNNETLAGQVVFYSHVHIIPRFKGDGFHHWRGRQNYDEGEAKKIANEINQYI
ncbi:MAG: histidine triad (HIT) family protein [Candidatus Paceibacteria bacterium]|jgi:histidine triad (HIT) family protein